MILQPEPVNFPICFKHKSGQIFGYLDNGFCLVATPSSSMIMLSDYHSKFSNLDMYEKHIAELKMSKTHEFISNENFDKILQSTVDSIFFSPDNDFNLVTLDSVKKRRTHEFGYYIND